MAEFNPIPLIDRLQLEQQYTGYTTPPDISDPGTIPYTPVGDIITPHTSTEVNTDPNITSDLDAFESYLTSRSDMTRTRGTAPRALGEVKSDRYRYMLPGNYDIEDAYAQNQTWTTKAFNGLTKGTVLTGTTFLQTTVGLLNGLYQAANDGRWASFYDNEFNRNLDELNKSLEDKLPSYETKKFRDARWYSPDYLFTGNFLWEGVIKNLGFAAGAALSGLAFSSVFKGLGALARTSAAGKVEQAILAAEEAIALGEGATGIAGRTAGLTKELGGYSNLLNKGFRASVAGFATTGEAGIEAYHNLNEYRKAAIDEYKRLNNGVAPTGKDLDLINKAAEEVGNASFKANMTLLGMTNYIQFPTILGKSYKTDKVIANRRAVRTSPIERIDGKYVAKTPSKLKRAGNIIRNPYIFSYSEALEEGGQFAISESSSDFFDKKYGDEAEDNTWFESLVEGVKKTLTTDEGMKNVLIGGLSGAIMLGPGRVGQAMERRANTGKALADFKIRDISDFISDTYDSALRGKVLEREYTEAVENGDILEANEKEQDYVINYLLPRIKYGRHDLVLQEIEDIRQLAATEQGWAQLVSEGKIKEGDTRESLYERLDNLERTAQYVAQTYEDLSLKYGSIQNEDGSLRYPKEVMDKLLYTGAKIAYYNEQIPLLSDEIVGLTAPLEPILQGDMKALEEAQMSIIANEDMTDDQIETQIEKLNRVAMMSQYKKQKMREYNDIKINPHKYAEISKPLKDEDVDLQGAPDQGLVTIETKKFPEGKQYKVGKKYILGNVYEEDAKGRKVFRFPTLTFLGENADGTIKIQDSKGKIRDVSKAVFEDYNLGSPEALENSPDGSFYQRNANKIVSWNRGKNKGGIVKGRIKWDNKNDNLVFVYREGGRTKEKIINVDSFAPKEAHYDRGAFFFDGELTAQDKADINKAATSGRTAEKIAARQAKRAELLTQLYVDVTEKHEATEKLIEKKKKDLTSIKERLTALKDDIAKNAQVDKRVKKGIRFRKATREAMGHSLKLSRMIAELETEIAALEDQNLHTNDTLAYIEHLSDNLDQMPDATKDFLDEIKFEQMVINDLVEQTNKQVSAIRELLNSARKAFDSAVKFISSLISDFENRYPKVPRIMDQSWVDFIKANPNFLKLKPNYREELAAIDEQIYYIEEETIAPNENRIKDLEEHLALMEEDLGKLELQSRAIQEVINRFSLIYDDYMAKKEEKEAMMLNEQLHQDILGTLDTSEPSHPGNDGYEANAKKSKVQVPSSTIVSSDFDEKHVLRANRFAYRFQRMENKHKIRAVVVTNKTEDGILPGLIAHVKAVAEKKGLKVDADKAIFAVFVQMKEDGTYDLVNEQGQPLTTEEQQDAVNSAIYQPFPLSKLTANYKGNIESMFREEVTNEERIALTEQYVKWRNTQLKAEELPEPAVMHPSFGTPIYEGGSENARVDVFASDLITEEDLEARQVLQVATTNEAVTNNGVTYSTPLGRVFLNIMEGLVPMNASRIGKKKGLTLYKVLEQLSKDLSANGKITDDSKKMIEWLRTVVQWGTPKEGKEAGYSSVWFDIEEVTQDDGQIVSEPRLFISGLGFSMPFIPSAIAANKDKMVEVLGDLFHNVKSKWVNEDNYNVNYSEIVDIDSSGNAVYRHWENYQTYLLSPNGRKINEVPLTSPFASIVEDYDVNRNGIYFTFDNAEEMYEVPTAPVAEEAPAEAPVAEEPKLVTTVPVFDNTTNNMFVFKDGKAYAKYRVNKEGVITTLETFNDEHVKAMLMKKYGPEYGPAAITDMREKLKENIKTTIIDPALQMEEEPIDVPEVDGMFPEGEDPLAGGIVDEDPEVYRVMINDPYEKQESWDRVEKWMKKNFPHVPFYRVQTLIRATKGRKALGMFHKGAIYVYENAEVGTTYHEVFEAVWSLFTSPQEKKQVAQDFRSRKGSFVDRESGRTIAYSDATSQELKEALAEEFREYRMKKDAKPKNLIQRIFQAIIDYVKGFLSQFSKNPLTIKEMFDTIDRGAYNNYDRYGKVFEEISDAPPIYDGYLYLDEMEGDETSQFRLDDKINIPTKQLHDIMQHMTYATIANLFKEDTSLLNDSAYSKSDLYFSLKNELIKVMSNQNATIKNGITKAHMAKNWDAKRVLMQKRADLYKLLNDINENWEAIVDRHVENLQTYNIIFDENDYVLLNDENNTGRGDYLDSRKIDPFKKASAAVKLLMATIPKRDGKTGKFKKSSIGGFVMLDIAESFSHIMEELQSSRDINDMMVRLNKLSNNYPDYQLLYRRLTKEPYTPINSPTETVSPPSFVNMTEAGFELLSSFWRTFKKQKPDIITVFRLENGETVVTDTSLTSAAKQATFNLRNNLISAIKGNKGDGLFIFANGKYTAVKRKGAGFNLVELDPKNPETYTSFLKKLGINFTPGEVGMLTDDQRKTFFKRTEGLKNELMKIEDVKTINKSTLNIEGDLFNLGILTAIIENEEYQNTYFNVNGEMAQTFIGPNALSNFYHTIGTMKNKGQLTDTLYSYLLTDVFSKNSVIMKRLFSSTGTQSKKGNTEEIMKPVFIDGTVDEVSGKKTESSSLKYVERVVQEMNANLKGVFLNLVPGDAAIEWAIKMYKENNPFVSEESWDSKQFLDIFKGYLIDEINLIRESRHTQREGNSGKFRFFADILPEYLQREILKRKSSAEKVVRLPGLESKIDAAIIEYIKKDAQDNVELMKEFDLVYSDEGEWFTPRINFNQGEPMTETSFKKKMQVLSANYMISNIELHKLIYSDPYHYSDELKRIKSFSSPRQALINGSNSLNTALDRIYNKGFNPEEAGWSDMRREYLRAVTFSDIWSVNKELSEHSEELKSYIDSYEETDGGGMVPIKAKRKIMLRAGMWNERLEAQYRYDIAYEDFFEGRELTDEQLEVFDPENPLRLNPGEQELYTPIKPVVSGRKQNGREYNDVLLDKFALFPLSYRMLHIMGGNSNMFDLYKKMQREDVDYAVFKSGRKVGAELTFDPYNDKGRISELPFQTKKQAENPNLRQTVINVPFSIISIQTDVPTKVTEGTTQGSQITKLATLDFMEAGVPIDFVIKDKDGNEITDISERYNDWISLTEDVTDFEEAEDIRAMNSPLYKEIVHNRRLLDGKVDIGYRRLLSQLGITVDPAGNMKITKRERMALTLRDEIFSRDVNENISDSFKGFLKGEVILEGTPLYKQIRNILMSIARKNIIRPKINGGFKVQMFNTFFEDNRIEKTKDGKGNDVYASGDLKFYRDEDGQRVCEIMVARWFDSPLNDEELLDYLNNTEEGKKLLSGIGYRIPTQKQNSIDVFKIGKLLPKEMKDTVVVPVDLVKKAGSDFDIDKLSVYLKNALSGRKPKALEFLTKENSKEEQRYFEWVKDISGYDSKNYFRFLSKEEISTLRKKYKREKLLTAEEYDDLKGKIKGDSKEMFETLFTNKKDWQSAQDMEMRQLFQQGKRYYWQLSEKTLKHFKDLRSHMLKNDINGSIEIENYLSLSEVMSKKHNVPAKDKLLLSQMINNYKKELEVLGYHSGQIDRIQEAINKVKEAKSENMTSAISAIVKANQALEDEFREGMDEINLQWAKEVAQAEGLETFEEFKNFDVYHQNASKNLDNAYIDSLVALTSHPTNFKRLLVPNSADEAKALSAEIRELLGKPVIDYGKPGNMLRRRFMSELRHAFVSGKYAIGISAVAQTNHSQNQRTLVFLDEAKLKYLDYSDALYLTDTKINFKNHNQVNDRVMLSGIKSADGKNFISDVIGQFIDGYVDISKGPWIMELGATANVAGLWLFLLKAGVPFKDVAYFMNQPIIREYIKQLDSQGYSTIFSRPTQEYVRDKFITKSKMEIEQIPGSGVLRAMIGKSIKELTDDQKAQQQYILTEFLKYGKMSQHLLTYIQGSNFDTANFNDSLLVYKKDKQLDSARFSIISSVDENLQSSFVGNVFDKIKKARDGFSELLVSDQSRAKQNQKGPREVIEKILEPYVSPYISDKNFVKMGRKVVETLFDWTMQTGSSLNTYIQSTFMGTKDTPSVVQQVMDFKKSVVNNANHPLFDNIIINSMQLVPTGREDQIDNIVIQAKNNKIFNQNLVINAFREIKAYLENEGSDLYDKLMRLAILQSGLTTSYLSFTDLIPYEEFKKYYNDYITMLGSNPTLEDFLDLNEFQRTHPTDRDIVPVLKAKDGLVVDSRDPFGQSMRYWNTATTFMNKNLQEAMDTNVLPKMINVSTWDFVGGYDIISWYWEDVPLTADEIKKGVQAWQKKKQMVAKGDYSFRKKGLFQKVYRYNDQGVATPLIQTQESKKKGQTIIYENFVYKLINTRGFGPRAQEHYSKLVDSYSGEVLGKQSRINNDFVNVKEVSDKKIVHIFDNGVVPKKGQLTMDFKDTGDSSVPGINISSYESGLGKDLSNFAKIPVNYQGVNYFSSESAYQAKKKNLANLSNTNVKVLMTNIITEKLRQHPSITRQITEKGGMAFLENSTHNLVRDGREIKKDRWTGKNGLFMQALRSAYAAVQSETQQPKPAVKQAIKDVYTKTLSKINDPLKGCE